MNGKDLFIALGYVDRKWIEEAEMEELHPVIHSWKRPLLIAALVAAMLMLVGCSVAYAQGWFTNYFAQNSKASLSPGQMEYIAENEQVIGESQVQNEWTVELRSAINDGTVVKVIIGITAPEGVDLDPEIVDGNRTEDFYPGNDMMSPDYPPRTTHRVLSASQGIWAMTYGRLEEDSDGLSNTKNYVLSFRPEGDGTVDPFGPEAEYYIHIENIVREYQDTEYKQSLLEGKYAGQEAIMFEPEEARQMRKTEVLVEGTWDFTVRFDGSSREMELITEPVPVMAYVYRQGEPLNEFFYDTVESYEEVAITSFILRPLSAEIVYECDASVSFTGTEVEKYIYAVMKDGSQIELRETVIGSDNFTMAPISPIVLEEVDHILMPDGTKIPMP